MGKVPWLAVTALLLLILTAGYGLLGFLLGAAIVGIPYLLSCAFHPRTTHRPCRGTGYHRSVFFPWSTRRCRGCSGGLQVRHGARAIGLPHVKSEHAARTRAVARARQERRWR